MKTIQTVKSFHARGLLSTTRDLPAAILWAYAPHPSQSHADEAGAANFSYWTKQQVAGSHGQVA